MARTFGALLAERRGAMVGRDAELARLLALLDDDGPLVAVVHGVAGVGQVHAAARVRAEAGARGATRRRASTAARSSRRPAGFAAWRVARAATRAARSQRPPGRCSTIDTAERLRLIDAWLRQELPAVAARPRARRAGDARRARAPRGARRSASCCARCRSARWRRPMPPRCCAAPGSTRSRPRGSTASSAATRSRCSSRASAVRERPDAAEDAVLPTVVQELAALYLDGLDPPTRRRSTPPPCCAA